MRERGGSQEQPAQQRGSALRLRPCWTDRAAILRRRGAPSLLVQAAEPGLRVQGALVTVTVTVDEDDSELRERLLGELDEPDQALLAWLGNALAPLDSSRD